MQTVLIIGELNIELLVMIMQYSITHRNGVSMSLPLCLFLSVNEASSQRSHVGHAGVSVMAVMRASLQLV